MSISVMDEMYLDRMSRVKAMVLSYPHYTDAQREMWFDAIDGAIETRQTALRNAHEAMEEALKCKSF